MRKIAVALVILTAVALGGAAGAGAAWLRTAKAGDVGGRGPGPWRTLAGAGEAKASAYQRAVIARTGIWALPQSEVIYFVSENDSDGRPLDARCTYEVAGPPMTLARWWSLGVYKDYFWIDNPRDRYSFTKTNVTRDATGRYRVLLSPTPQAGDWLPLGDKPGRLTLMYRMYQPAPSVARNPEATPLPSIRRLQCA